MKKIICLLLAIAFVLPLSGCDSLIGMITPEDPCNDGHTFSISYTNTCESDGYKISKCSVCNFEKKEEAKATGHNYDKNICSICNYEEKLIGNIPLKTRKEMASELLKMAPCISDIDSFKSVCSLYRQTQEDLEYYEEKVKSCEAAYIDAQNNKVVRILNTETGQWEWKADDKEVSKAKSNLYSAKSALQREKELFEALEISIDLNGMGAAFNVLIEELSSEETSNKKIAQQLAVILLSYGRSVTSRDNPWKQRVFNIFNQVTGIKIDISQALS